jgi:hypothetical protein
MQWEMLLMRMMDFGGKRWLYLYISLAVSSTVSGFGRVSNVSLTSVADGSASSGAVLEQLPTATQIRHEVCTRKHE